MTPSKHLFRSIWRAISASRDVATLFAACVLVFVGQLVLGVDLAEKFFEFSSQHENLELDELVTTVLVLVVGLALILIRRQRLAQRSLDQLKASKTALDSEHNLLRGLIDALPDYIFIKDADGRFIITNEAHARASNAASSELLIGKTAFDLFPPELAAQYDADDRAIMESGKPLLNLERQTVGADGSRIWVSTTKVPLRDADGKVAGLVGISRDISERKQAEERVRAQEAFVRLVVDTVPHLIFVKDADGRYVLANQAMADLLAMPVEAIIGKTDQELGVPPEDAAYFAGVNEEVLHTRQPKFTPEDRITHPRTGQTRWHQSVVSPLETPDAKLDQVLVVATDITERKQAEEALRASEASYRRIVETATEGIWVINAEGMTSFVNQRMADMLGYAPEELTSHTIFDFMDTESGTIQNQDDFKFRHKDDRAVWAIGSISMLTDRDGEYSGVLVMVTDITERKQAEVALRESETRYRLVAQATNDAIWDWNLTTDTVTWSGAITALFGYRADEIPATMAWWAARVHPEDLDTVQASIYAVVQGSGHYWTAEYRLQRADETYALVIDRAFVERDDMGKPLRMIGSTMDVTERKQAEETLAGERNLLRTVLDTIPDAVYIKGAEGQYITCNARHAMLCGVDSPEALVGLTDLDLFPDREPEYFTDELYLLLSGEPLVDKEEPFGEKIGIQGWHLTTKVPLRGANGEVIGLVGIGRDITERKRAEEALAAERNLLRTLIDHMPDFIYVKDTEGRFVTNNLASWRGFGASSDEELVGKSDFDLLPLEMAKAHRVYELQVLESGQALTGQEEFTIEPGTGRGLWVLSSKVPLRDSNGQVIGLVGISRDITERRQAEETLRASEVRFRANFDQAAVGISHTDMQGRFIRVNQKFCDITGYTRDEILALTWQEITHPDDLSLDLESTERLLNGEISTFSVEERYIRKDGSPIWVNITLSLVHSDPDYFIAVVEDISQRKRAEEALKNQQAFLRQVIDANPNLIFVKDWDGRFVLVNKAHADLMGTTVEEMVGKRDSDFGIPLEEDEHFLQDDRDVIRTRQAKFIPEETITSAASGQTRWLETVKVPLIVPDGISQQLLGVATDITERKLAGERLRESEERFRLLFEHSPDAILLIDPHDPLIEWPIVDCNNAACTMNGYSREELIGHPIDMLHTEPADPAGRADYVERMRQSGVLTVEAVHRRKDGALFHIQTHTAFVNLNGRELVLGIDRDITERKRAEEALRESEERFRANFEQAAVGVSHTHPEGTWLRVNQKLCDILGYTYDELMLLTWQEITYPDDLATDVEQWQQLMAGEILTYTLEKRYVHKDGSLIWVNITVSLVRTAEGAPDYFIAVVEDISERKSTEEALYQTHLKLEAAYDTFERLIQQIPIGIQVFDSNGLCLDVNQAHLDIFGVDSRERLVQHYNIFADPMAEQSGTTGGARRALAGDIVHLGDLSFNFEQADPLYAMTSGERTIHVSFFPIFDSDGQIRQVVALNQDVTERKQAEAQQIELAAERARMKVVERFVQDASHDLRTPLTIMQTSAYLLAKSTDPARRQQHLTNLDEQIAHIARVLQDFLDLSRLDQLMTELHPEPCDLSALVNSVCGEQQALAARKGHVVQMDLSDTLPPVMGDRNELQRALRHLVLNALNYTPEGGTISLVTRREEDYAVVEVRDNGIGIDSAELPFIFERFYRADQARGTDTGGAGLGLTISKKIVEAHQGRIEVESTAGVGSVFRVYLPL